MRRRKGGQAEAAAPASAPEEEEEKRPVKKRNYVGMVWNVVILLGAVSFYAWCYVVFVMLPPTKPQGPLFAILGTMGAGTVAMEDDLRRLGIEATHEVTLGADGVVSWLHVALYSNRTRDELCSEFLPQAFHPQLLFVELRNFCGQKENCWKQNCPKALERWRGCALRGECPIPFTSRPVVVVRHPLRTIESLGDFCDSAKMIAAERVLGLDLVDSSCLSQLAKYWLAFYEPFAESRVYRREDLDGCELVSILAADGGQRNNTRIQFAQRACRGDLSAQFWRSAYVARQMVNRLKSEGYAGLSYDSNSRYDREKKRTLLWTDIPLEERKRVAVVASRLGYKDADNFIASK